MNIPNFLKNQADYCIVISLQRMDGYVINNIGNLTYISHKLNHWETGLGPDSLDLEIEVIAKASLRGWPHDGAARIIDDEAR